MAGRLGATRVGLRGAPTQLRGVGLAGRGRKSFGIMGFVPMRVPLSLACGAYDRTAGLARGSIQPEGVDLTFLALPVEETFFRMLRHREFDAAEMSLSSYLISREADAPFVAIPVFVSRSFRHNGIYVRRRAGSPRRRSWRAGRWGWPSTS